MNEVLWQAVQAGDLSGVQAAVSSGADVNFRGPHEDRVRHGRLDTDRCLVVQGFNYT
eukprot:m.92580 g.92580  ORF g.92580 m.92580 type:complete len:57 (-) comp14669_c0_seq9:3759-3929(-)